MSVENGISAPEVQLCQDYVEKHKTHKVITRKIKRRR